MAGAVSLCIPETGKVHLFAACRSPKADECWCCHMLALAALLNIATGD